jgi:predicted cupin superfamily sugar epimerase
MMRLAREKTSERLEAGAIQPKTQNPKLKTNIRMTAADIIRLLDLRPHPEGGHYRETFRDPMRYGDRAASTAIYFLLAADEVSHWHRIDSVEVWHWYAGAPLVLSICADGQDVVTVKVGMDINAGQRPQFSVPGGVWQFARSLGEWTLAGCTVAPGFSFDCFELAPAGREF